MLKGKWYKVYWRFKNSEIGTRSKTIDVWAFSFNSAEVSAKIKLGKEKNFDEEKILVTRIDFISDGVPEKIQSD